MKKQTVGVALDAYTNDPPFVNLTQTWKGTSTFILKLDSQLQFPFVSVRTPGECHLLGVHYSGNS
jgi:hypothetical protein